MALAVMVCVSGACLLRHEWDSCTSALQCLPAVCLSFRRIQFLDSDSLLILLLLCTSEFGCKPCLQTTANAVCMVVHEDDMVSRLRRTQRMTIPSPIIPTSPCVAAWTRKHSHLLLLG